MPKTRKIAATILIVAVCTILSAIVLRPREPEYQGKKLSKWMEQVQVAYNRIVTIRVFEISIQQSEATRAVEAIGTNGIPYFLEMIQRRDSPLKKKLINWQQEHLMIFDGTACFAQDSYYREQGYLGIKILGTNAVSAIPLLIQKVRNNDQEAFLAVIDLRTIGPAVVPSLAQLLKCKEDDTREKAMELLEYFGPESEDALPELLMLLSNGTRSEIQVRALDIIGTIHQNPKLVVPALIDLLKRSGNNTEIFIPTLIALAHYKESATDALPFLQSYVNDPRTEVRRKVLGAIGSLSEENTAHYRRGMAFLDAREWGKAQDELETYLQNYYRPDLAAVARDTLRKIPAMRLESLQTGTNSLHSASLK